MIHEALIYLWHNTGSEINQMGENTTLFELQEFMDPAEQKLFFEIVQLEIYYNSIISFSKTIQNLNNGESSGLYIEAFAKGINDVLSDYRNSIIELENKFLNNPKLPLTFIKFFLKKYQTLFQKFKIIMELIEKRNIHGCMLIGQLNNYVTCGIDSISESAITIIKSINMVFYEHLCNWIIYGDLIDIYEEFFIVDGKCSDEAFIYDDETTVSTTLIFKKNQIDRSAPVRKFFINWDLVPLFIDKNTAESILFMGRIVWIIRNNPNKIDDEQYKIEFKRDIWNEKDIEYYGKLQSLEENPFDSEKFGKILNDCKNQLTKYLWHLMLDEGNLIKHLYLLRDYYALGRGELFQQFISQAELPIKQLSSSNILDSFNSLFIDISRKIYGDSDKTYQRFEFTISQSSDGDTSLTTTNIWSKLQLKFVITWPLHIVFHPQFMKLYNKLFCYLLRLKKTQINLLKLWESHMLSKQTIDRRIDSLRQQLIFLIENLQYYLQVDVIEAEFSLLLKAIEKANEFNDIIKVHHEFLTNLMAKTFILKPDEFFINDYEHILHQKPIGGVQVNTPSKIYRIIIKLLALCDEFCLIASEWNGILTIVEVKELEKFRTNTNNIVESLLFTLYNLHGKTNCEYFLKLGYQLDFNGFFTKILDKL